MNSRIAIVSGIRTPFCKAGGLLKDLPADDLGAVAVKEVVARSPIDPKQIDEVILGNVMAPAHLANIARVIAVKSGLPERIPAFTVNRNCASGMEAVTSAATRILTDHADIVVAGGVESMSQFTIGFPPEMRDYLQRLKRAKTIWERLRVLLAIRPSLFVPQLPVLGDPLCGLSMGQTAELIARELGVTRHEQDEFALNSQKRAWEALQNGYFAEEIVPIALPPAFTKMQLTDDGPRENQTLEALAKLKPSFDKVNGTVTAGNASQVTDGAVALLLMRESKAKELGIKPLGYLRAFASAGLDPSRMGLGPVYATSKLLERENLSLDAIDLIEINEAFAGQVLAVMRAAASDRFAKEHLNRSKAVGTIDPNKLNVHGGAIALGHPLGASGARLILTLCHELRRRNKKLGLATLCVGGGQGEACLIEVES